MTGFVEATETLRPDGYDLQARVKKPGSDRWMWYTVKRFQTLSEAQEYESYLYFLTVMATTVDHRSETDLVTWRKLLNELELPTGYRLDVRYRIVSYYDDSRFRGLPLTYRSRF
ncbi:MAG: hypothetical protein NXI04_24120 [Planctomycetaceae bacterium]|nr:hypothetical protein [Planctomycetaceae bacterium]